MVWWIQVLEIANQDGEGTGRYRLTATSDEGGGGPFGLCEHMHKTKKEADECEEARKEAERY